MFYLNNRLQRTPSWKRTVVYDLLSTQEFRSSVHFDRLGPRCEPPAGSADEGSGMSESKATHRYTILITDDDRDCREALRDIMEPQGFRTFLASCGEEALDIVGGEVIHLALLDMHMPTLTGLETLRLLRQIREVLPAILVTADANESVIRQAQQARAYSVIPKPISKSVVIYTVVRALLRTYGEPVNLGDGNADCPR
jgi:CheY-like chemotaxis protein